MSLTALRAAIVSSIDSGVSTFRSVTTHGGKFNAEELKRIATKSPACRVAILDINPIERDAGAQAVGHVTIGAFVITQGDSETKRDAAALALTESISGLVVKNDWDYEHSKAPERIRADNLFSGKIDRMGVAMWVVMWTQQTDMAIISVDDFDEFNQLRAKFDFDPMDGVIEDEMQIWLQGTLMSAYGQIYVSTPAATSIAVADTFQKVAGTTTLLRADGMSMTANNRLNHDDAVTRPVKATAKASVSVSSDAEVSIGIAKNGVIISESVIKEDVASADGAEAMGCEAVVEVEEDDYLELWTTADSTVNVTFEKMTLVAIAT